MNAEKLAMIVGLRAAARLVVLRTVVADDVRDRVLLYPMPRSLKRSLTLDVE